MAIVFVRGIEWVVGAGIAEDCTRVAVVPSAVCLVLLAAVHTVASLRAAGIEGKPTTDSTG